MITRIIVMRHGESESDKSNPMRKLTPSGVKGVHLSSQKIKKLIKKPCLIISSNTFRTIQTASILAKELNLNFIVSRSKLRIKEGQKIPLEGYDAKMMMRRFFRLTKKYYYVNSLIIVGNSGGLEAFVNYQDKFIPKRKIYRELNYAEFVILEKKP